MVTQCSRSKWYTGLKLVHIYFGVFSPKIKVVVHYYRPIY